MWLFIPCQECVFSSSDFFWNKYQLDHNASYSSSSFPGSKHCEQYIQLYLCVYAYIYFWHHVLIKFWHSALLTYTILFGTLGWFTKQNKQSELSRLTTATGVREILLKNIFFWITTMTLYFCESSWRMYKNYQWRPVNYKPCSLRYLWFTTGKSSMSLMIKEKSKFHIR